MTATTSVRPAPRPPVHRGFCTCVLLACALLLAVPASAQDQPVRDILFFLLTNRSIITDDFDRDEAAAAATADAIARALQIELSTLPISSSSGGFTYRFNPALGTTERTSAAFGPFFVERALTVGRGRASLGFSFRHARFESLDGNDLRDGTFITTANTFTDETAPFDSEALTLELETNTFTLFSSVGLADRFDIGVAVPLVWLDLRGERINTFRGQTSVQALASATVVGLADVAVRAKYHLFGRASGLAAGAEITLPTGKEEDLLGAGKAAYTALLVGSAEGAVAAAHFNLAYTTGGISDEIDYSAAVTVAAAPRLTLVGEFVGRSIDALGELRPLVRPHPTIAGVATSRLAPDDTAARTQFAVAGFKWNVGSSWLLTGNVLVPLSDRGLKAKVVPAIALDYTF